MVRIFSAEPSRQADQATLNSYDEEVTNFGKTVEQEIGGVKVSELVPLPLLLLFTIILSSIYYMTTYELVSQGLHQ